jgi:hypothetical protein
MVLVRLGGGRCGGSWLRFAVCAIVLPVLVGLLAALLPFTALPARADGPTYLYAQSPCTPVYTAASRQSPLMTQLLGGTDVTAVGGDANWTHARIWSGLDGYIPTKALGAQPPAHAREGVCAFPGLPDATAEDPMPSGSPWPLAAQGLLISPATLYSQADDQSLPTGALALGQSITIDQWTAGPSHQPWYHVTGTQTPIQTPVSAQQTPPAQQPTQQPTQQTAQASAGWVWSGSVRLTLPDPATRQVRGAPIWTPVAGKGMWFTNYLPHHADVQAMMRAAKSAGITHVYAEVAISKFGFYAPNTLDRLLPAAHAAGIKVLAWVYPDLSSVGDDIRLSARVATYQAPSGDRPDGLAADIEEATDSGSIYTYGEVLRGLLGPDTLLVATVFHPFARAGYPYAAIASSFNVLAPMNYWHSRSGRTYSAQDVARFVSTSILTIRAEMHGVGDASELPIEELGQTWDMFTDDSTAGPDAPTGDELTADMRTARELGCVGVSFYEWQTATQQQWAAISAYTW